jgi:putative phosphotransacetylase
MQNETIRRSVMLAVAKNFIDQKQGFYVPAAISARHVHLCQSDIDLLFGKGYTLKRLRDLAQPGQYACEEKVTLIGAKGRIDGVRVLGPARLQTQVEISQTDSYKVGIPPVVRMSGNIEGTPGCTLVGPSGEVKLACGVIVAARHLHMSSAQAALYGLTNGQAVSVKKTGIRETIFGNVVVRSGDGHELEMHIDTDEANAAGMTCGELLELLK